MTLRSIYDRIVLFFRDQVENRSVTLVPPVAAVEVCTGCGAPGRHPMVGVAMDRETGRFAAFPVCNACWRDPSHRVAPLKMHFFQRGQAAAAVAMAGSSNIGQ